MQANHTERSLSAACRPSVAETVSAGLAVWVVSSDKTRAVLRVVGELDLGVIDVLARALATQLGRDRDVLLDVSGMTFCGCTGLELLIANRGTFRDAGRRLTLTGIQGSLARLLQVLQLTQLFATSPAAAPAAGPLPPRQHRIS